MKMKYTEQAVETLDDAGSVIANKNIEIEQLRQRVQELEERRCEICGYAEHHREHTGCLRAQLAAEQLNNKLLRKALEAVIKVHGYESGIPVEALAQPSDTSALDAYVAEKVKEAGKFDIWKTNPYTKVLETSIKQLTRQRDLAVEAASDAATSLETIQLRSFGEESYLDSKPQMRAFAGARAKIARDALSTIKESEGK